MVKTQVARKIGQILFAAVFLLIGMFPARGNAFGQIPTQAPSLTPTLTPTQTLTPTPRPTLEPALNQWSEPYTFERAGWFPDVTADASGRVYVAWSNSVILASQGAGLREGFDVVLYSNSPDGNTWGGINEVAALHQSNPGSVEVTRPDMLVDSDGILHMTYRDINVHYAQAPVVLADNARFWSKSQQLNINQLAYFSKLAKDSQGRLHVFFTEDVPTSDCLICYHLFYRSSDDNGKTWTREIDISSIPTGSAKPHVLVDSKDYIHVVWEAGRGGTLGQLTDPTTVMYTVSYNRGESWAPPIEVVAPDAINSKNITIGADGAGNLVIVWWSLPEDVPYYQVSQDNGLSWTTPQRIPNVWGIWANYNSRLDTYSMATDSAGNLHLVMVGRLNATDTSLRVLHLTWNGSDWLPPEAIVSYSEDAPEWPAIAISNGNQLNVVWFVRGKNYIWAAAPDFYKILYSYSRVRAPRIENTPWPTIIPPTATPIVTETVEPTGTLLPVPDLGPVTVDPMDNAVVSETDQLLLAARAVIPAVVAVAILLVVILWRRH